jgi:hypothetical protein
MFSEGNRLKSISAATNNCNLLSPSGCFAKRTCKDDLFQDEGKARIRGCNRRPVAPIGKNRQFPLSAEWMLG